ncbi:class I SAM-dependent methyltransferase [Brachyspira intermedia]|uniref:class I SAM-dependent methyltransferase n=1 Tax=Brachyspira intermedia TaxID=84377 RepID=UPI0030044B4A
MYNHNLFNNEKYEINGSKFDDIISLWTNKYNSLMSLVQKRFLMSIISENNFTNILEIGVFNGVSSLCILKAGLSVNENFNLYSLDLNTDKKFVGQAANECCTDIEKKHYHLYLGKTTFDLEKILPKDIKFDLVFIDAAHHHPFPLIDILLTLPYTYRDTIIVLHDVVDYIRPNCWGANFLFQAWRGDKYKICDSLKEDWYPAMGCIKPYNTL